MLSFSKLILSQMYNISIQHYIKLLYQKKNFVYTRRYHLRNNSVRTHSLVCQIDCSRSVGVKLLKCKTRSHSVEAFSSRVTRCGDEKYFSRDRRQCIRFSKIDASEDNKSRRQKVKGRKIGSGGPNRNTGNESYTGWHRRKLF